MSLPDRCCAQAGDRQRPTNATGSPAAAVGALIEELLPTTFLCKAIGGFISALADVRLPADLATEIRNLKALLAHLNFHMDICELGGEADNEDGPVVVEL